MLVVSAIMVVISMAIYATLSNGIKIWERTQETIAGEDLNIFFDRFSRDLRNAFAFEDIPFSGGRDSVAFATLVQSARLKNRTVGQVVYFYDGQGDILKKEERDFSHVFKEEEGVVKQALDDVRSLKFAYYFYDTLTKEYSWLEEWSEKDAREKRLAPLPLAVRMSLELNNGDKDVYFTRTVNIPVSGR
jgi:hypothetical protein